MYVSNQNCHVSRLLFFFFNDTATTEIYTPLYTLSLHDALPISIRSISRRTASTWCTPGRWVRRRRAHRSVASSHAGGPPTCRPTSPSSTTTTPTERPSGEPCRVPRHAAHPRAGEPAGRMARKGRRALASLAWSARHDRGRAHGGRGRPFPAALPGLGGRGDRGPPSGSERRVHHGRPSPVLAGIRSLPRTSGQGLEPDGLHLLRRHARPQARRRSHCRCSLRASGVPRAPERVGGLPKLARDGWPHYRGLP